MQLTSSHPRTRPISAGHLRAFDAVARHLNFRAAGEELTSAGSKLLRATGMALERIGALDVAVDLNTDDVVVALRWAAPGATRLFG